MATYAAVPRNTAGPPAAVLLLLLLLLLSLLLLLLLLMLLLGSLLLLPPLLPPLKQPAHTVRPQEAPSHTYRWVSSQPVRPHAEHVHPSAWVMPLDAVTGRTDLQHTRQCAVSRATAIAGEARTALSQPVRQAL
jgi:hypothetical protein